MPEHPPCLTPILKHKSSFRSDLILFKCFNASSVKEIAGAIPPAVDGAWVETDRIDKFLLRLKANDRKETEAELRGRTEQEFFGRVQRDGELKVEENAILERKRGEKKSLMMVTTIADELYSGTSKQSNGEAGQLSNAETKTFDSNDCDGDELWHEDGSSWNGSNEELDKASELDREWQRRRDQFHTIGYRDGLMAGKEASAQEGFNIGFGESVFVGYKWGLVRGITSEKKIGRVRGKENQIP